jgi:hypothetical protein
LEREPCRGARVAEMVVVADVMWPQATVCNYGFVIGSGIDGMMDNYV